MTTSIMRSMTSLASPIAPPCLDGHDPTTAAGAPSCRRAPAPYPRKRAAQKRRSVARGLWSALEPHHEHVYVNFLMDEGEDRVREAYGPQKYDRLKALKRRDDSDNVLRKNQNVRPGV